VVDARLGYGSALVDAGQPAAAIGEITTAIADSLPAYGADSMFEGFASSHLARALLDRGELDEALRRIERSIALVKADAAPRSFTMGAALALRGHVLLAAHRPREAEEQLGTAVSIYAETLGPTHAATVAATINQAVAMAYLGKLEAAEALLGSLPEAGKSGPWMGLPAPHALGIVKRLAAQPQLALAQQRAALASLAEGPRSKFMRMAILTELGLSAVAAGEYQEAQTALTQSLQLASAEQSRVSAVRAEALLGMGLVHLHERRLAEAAAALQQSQDYWREQNPQSREFALTTWWLAQCQPGMRGRQDPASSAAAAVLSASPLPVDRLTVTTRSL
jgi:tetratricopeptide (TPR) repeat protein